MAMSKRVKKALQASITHWEVDILKNDIWPDNDNCPMCKIMEKQHWGYNCKACVLTRICEYQYRTYTNNKAGESVRKRKARSVINAMKKLLT